MRYFALLDVQHFVLYLFPALAFIVIFGVGLGYYLWRQKDSRERETRIIEKFPGGIEGRNAPFPLLIYLIMAGAVVWVFSYIIFTGILGVKI